MHVSGWAKFYAGCSTGAVLAMTLALGAAAQSPSAAPSQHRSKKLAATTEGGAAESKTAKKVSSKSSSTSRGKAAAASSSRKSGKAALKAGSKTVAGRRNAKAHHLISKPTPQSIRLTQAFTASALLRPMAQQLAATRSPVAYAGVLHYASTHPGEAAAAA
jgi:soluble lytic murein transglycosylase